ncbi:MAG TPA: di-heme oxidoredictase family protein [Myxococcota bacterium]|nr:di-heme oxidoredictase family protein [Myxococcota bacterium]
MKAVVVAMGMGLLWLWMSDAAVAADATTVARGGEVADVIAITGAAPTEAPAGFDGVTNGLTDDATFGEDRAAFDGVESLDEGLGPLYNAQACRECHQAPISGAASQVTELRVGHRDAFGAFVDPDLPRGDGGEVVHARSLVNDRSICPSAEFPGLAGQQRVPARENVRALRASLNTLGDGFVEAIPSSALRAVAERQCRWTRGAICGRVITVPVLEAGGTRRVARFGWKNQHASLLSFSADAYLNEMGITSLLLPTETATLCDAIEDPEDEIDANGLGDVDHFARFMRATKAPPRYASVAASADAVAGSALFDQVGCNICHARTFVTAPPGSVLNGGTLVVSDAVGNKLIHPFSDFLLHDIGTGDGIVQNGGPATANTLRTAPLWGVHVRGRLMHDLTSLNFDDAIARHRGEAIGVTLRYRALRFEDQRRLKVFLSSL